ncbi:MAG TPA: FGGY-family carbohydrate kinase [Polyangiaceae bacterium]|jgi:FGGY-family pentulose kinase
MTRASLYLGVDVGTASARAGVFDAHGELCGMGVEPTLIFRPREDFAQQSSEDIWRAVCVAVRRALSEAGAQGDQVGGIGFDATCSLVALDEQDRPVSVSPDADAAQNVILWLDHRALAEAAEINATGHDVLKYVGGAISPEMEMPKLLWLARHLPQQFRAAYRFFDLPDFLSYRATGCDVRSLCTTVCKWTYLGHEPRGAGWSRSFFDGIGLGELLADDARRIGSDVRALGERVGALQESAARELGLTAGTAVAVSVIDAHAGGIGLLGTPYGDARLDADSLPARLALIGGTSSCHMAVSPEARFVPGIWGPYYSAMIPGLWLTEGGQSATGALIDHVLESHARYAELKVDAERANTTVYALLNQRLAELARTEPFPAALTRDLHVLPDHHGNRSPRADPSLRGMICGLKLSASVDALALEYLATIQAIAHGTRHIIDTMNAHGYAISTVVATGGDCKNPLFLREHADITGCPIVLPRVADAVLLGSAMLGAVASGDQRSVLDAMATMSGVASVVEPCGGEVARFHRAKHEVFLRMHGDQLAYRAAMQRGLPGTRGSA